MTWLHYICVANKMSVPSSCVMPESYNVLKCARIFWITLYIGYNSDLHSWGAEDTDVNIRLAKVLGLSRIEYGRARHIGCHSLETKGSRELRARSNLENINRIILNYSLGKLQGTLEQDCEVWLGKVEILDLSTSTKF